MKPATIQRYKYAIGTHPMIDFQPNLINRLRQTARVHKKTWRFLLVALTVIGLYHLIMNPIKNPFANDPVRIHGRFPFSAGFELEFMQDATNTEPWHQWVCGGFGFFANRATCSKGYEILRPKKLGNNLYELTVYRDQYFYGLAGWVGSANSYRAFLNSKPPHGLMFESFPINSVDMVCDESPELMRKIGDRLFCVPQQNNKEFKNHKIALEFRDQTSDDYLNFWLESELRQYATTQANTQ